MIYITATNPTVKGLLIILLVGLVFLLIISTCCLFDNNANMDV